MRTGVDAMLDALDKKIIAAVQEEFPLVKEPYRELAAKIGISEEELLVRLQKYHQSGKMRRMGAVLRHREVGYSANALCSFKIPNDQVEKVAAVVITYPEVSHCYERVTYPNWPYNFYIMLHGHSREECKALAADIAETIGYNEYLMLFSTREWKKTSMRYFEKNET